VFTYEGYLMSRFFIWVRDKVYTWRNRVYFTEQEVHYLVDITDAWIEAYPSIAREADDDEIEGLHNDMSVAIDVRDKLWRQLNNG
jgi:hypothetical protein